MQRLEGKAAIVTGGGKGIGAAVARRLRDEGARVAVLDRDPATAADDPRLRFVRCDVASAREVREAVEETAEAFGGLHVLINNAGIQHYGTVVTTTEDDWDRVLNVNLKSAFLCAKYAIPHIQRSGGGIVVNMASVQAHHSQANVAPYTTSKTAMLGLTRSIAVDFAPSVRSVAVCPGTVDTPMVNWSAGESGDPDAFYDVVRRMHLAGRIASPEEIAGLVAYLCSDEAAFITGHSVRIDGGLGVQLGGSVDDR